MLIVEVVEKSIGWKLLSMMERPGFWPKMCTLPAFPVTMTSKKIKSKITIEEKKKRI
jgi:hypothetical protein